MRPALAILNLVAATVVARETALDRYVREPDASFRYALVGTTRADGLVVQTLDMTSQAWRAPGEVDRPEWRHWLLIARPEKVEHDTALLFLSGGTVGDRPPTAPAAFLRRIALATHSVVAELRMVPSQPLVLAGQAKGIGEDDLIVYTWDKFLHGGDERWPLRLPMTKSAVRAMDAVTGFCASEAGGGLKVGTFVVSGASKRGWTTWTTAAVDPRVVAIAPIVIDVLNIDRFYDHMYRSYGAWPDDVYTAIHIHDWMGRPRYRQLMEIEDPYEYRERFTMPKLLINSAGDQCFPPDSSRFYWDDLPGPKCLRYVPNSNHSLGGTDAMDSLLAFYGACVRGDAMPRYDWTFADDGSIRVTTPTPPREVKVWAATNPDARNFRLDKIGPAYKASPAAALPGGVYVGSVPKPERGWTAFFVELTWDMPGGVPIKLTTAVRIIPETLPAPSYVPQPVK